MKTRATTPAVTAAASAAGLDGDTFDWLPPEIFYAQILLKVELADRLTCAIAVCKSWRTLQKEPSLWRDIRVRQSADQIIIVDGIEKPLDDDDLVVDDAGLERLLNTIDASNVRRFRSYVSDHALSLSSEGIKHALSRFTQLDGLDLSGSCASLSRISDLLRHAIQQPWIQTLKELILYEHAPLMDSMALASACVNLESLTAEPRVMTASNLTALASAWSEARGAPPALKQIRMYGIATVHLQNLVSVGSLFPALETLYLSPFAFDLTTAMAPMNSLLHLIIDRLFDEDDGHTMATTEGMEATIRAMLTASPNLQTFQLLHGESKGNPRSAYPGVGTSLTLLPRTLERLYLSDVTLLRADDIDGAALPNLKFLTMLRCGAASIEIETRLIAQCPKLRWQTCCVSVHYCG